MAGIVAAITGAVLASGPELRGEQHVKQRAIWYALAAAVGFGITMLAIARGSASSSMFTMVGMRSASVAAFGIAAIVLRSVQGVRPRDLPKLALLGLGDVTANALLGFATTMGLLSITAVLSALYPVVTVGLAAVILHERMKPVQIAGVVLAFVGVGLIAGGWMVSLAPVELVETRVARGFDTLNQQTPTGFDTVNHNRWSSSSRPRSAGVSTRQPDGPSAAEHRSVEFLLHGLLASTTLRGPRNRTSSARKMTMPAVTVPSRSVNDCPDQQARGAVLLHDVVVADHAEVLPMMVCRWRVPGSPWPA